jgi:hypothetical protein
MKHQEYINNYLEKKCMILKVTGFIDRLQL